MLSDRSGINSISITDLLGNVVAGKMVSAGGAQTISFDLTTAVAGIYLIHVESAEGKLTKKVVIY